MKINVKIAILTCICGINAALSGTAAAQDSGSAALEEVVVTGSRIARKDLTSVGPVTIITAPEIAATGVTSLEVLLQRLPSSAGFGGC